MAVMLTLAAWILGIGLGVSLNVASDDAITWWYGLIFGLVLFPAIFLLGMIFPRLAVSFASGAMIGGGIAVLVSLFTAKWAYMPGSLLTTLVGFLSVSGQWARIDAFRESLRRS